MNKYKNCLYFSVTIVWILIGILITVFINNGIFQIGFGAGNLIGVIFGYLLCRILNMEFAKEDLKCDK